MQSEPLFRYGLLAYFLVYFVFAFLIRSIVVFRRTGLNPLVLPHTQDAHGYVARAFKFLMGCCAMAVIALGMTERALAWSGPIAWLQAPVIFYCGLTLLGASLLWLLAAQSQMGISWRIGIDTRNRTDLVQVDLFSWSRNPIFLAMRVSLLGLFLAVPSAVTLAILCAGEILMQVQVRLEEQHLLSLHGQAYADYCRRVRRWL